MIPNETVQEPAHHRLPAIHGIPESAYARYPNLSRDAVFAAVEAFVSKVEKEDGEAL